MPLLLPVTDLGAGMRLAEPFVHNGRVMFAADKVLDAGEIDTLRRRYPHALIKVADAVLDGLVAFDDDQRDRDVAHQAQSRIAQTLVGVSRSVGGRQALSGRDYRALEAAALDVMRYIAEHPVSAAMLSRAMPGSGFLADHTGAVFYLAMVLGSNVKGHVVQERLRQTRARNIRTQTVFDLVPLGLAAVFMDLSLHAIAEVFDNPKAPISEADIEHLRNHPAASVEMLPEVFPPAARGVIRTHHENAAGRGYPEALEGDRLHIFSRILRICDAFAAVTATEVFAGAMTPARALWEMTWGRYRRYFDPILMPLFARLIQPFPIGARLRLSDGRYAVVVRHDRGEPFKPMVVIAFDAEGRRLGPGQLEGPVSLGRRRDLKLAAFGEEDLHFLYQSDEHQPRSPQPAVSGAGPASRGGPIRTRLQAPAAICEPPVPDPAARFRRPLGALFP